MQRQSQGSQWIYRTGWKGMKNDGKANNSFNWKLQWSIRRLKERTPPEESAHKKQHEHLPPFSVQYQSDEISFAFFGLVTQNTSSYFIQYDLSLKIYGLIRTVAQHSDDCRCEIPSEFLPIIPFLRWMRLYEFKQSDDDDERGWRAETDRWQKMQKGRTKWKTRHRPFWEEVKPTGIIVKHIKNYQKIMRQLH